MCNICSTCVFCNSSSSIISPPIDPNAENANTQRALYTFLPMMIGWFALNVPSGLGLYYLANTVMTTLIQVRSMCAV